MRYGIKGSTLDWYLDLDAKLVIYYNGEGQELPLM
jgi:hypothetical protein